MTRARRCPDRRLAQVLAGNARAFREIAQAGNSEIDGFRAYFLAIAIELALKAYLLQYGITDDWNRIHLQHDLHKAMRCARMAGLAVELTDGASPRGYLAAEARPDLTMVLAPPPERGSPRDNANTGVFMQTRVLKGTPRWVLATDDVSGDAYHHFAQALGVRLTRETAPILTALLDRSGNDRSVVGQAKTHWGTRRPYIDTDQPICEAKTDHLAGNPDYPSGHSAHGVHVAMILAELAPQRADALYARGREFAESRYICGSHSYSAVEAGIQAGMVIYGAEQRSDVFRGDMLAARAEVQAALAHAAAIQ